MRGQVVRFRQDFEPPRIHALVPSEGFDFGRVYEPPDRIILTAPCANITNDLSGHLPAFPRQKSDNIERPLKVRFNLLPDQCSDFDGEAAEISDVEIASVDVERPIGVVIYNKTSKQIVAGFNPESLDQFPVRSFPKTSPYEILLFMSSPDQTRLGRLLATLKKTVIPPWNIFKHDGSPFFMFDSQQPFALDPETGKKMF